MNEFAKLQQRAQDLATIEQVDRERAMTITRANRAIRKYGVPVCMEAFKYSQQGEGPSTIGVYLGISTTSANSAINAGRYLAEKTKFSLKS